MADTPQETMRKAALWLRGEDKKFSKAIRFSKYKTPWDLDDIRLQWRDKKELIPASVYGREVMLTGDPKMKSSDKIPLVDIGDMLLLQFIPPKDLDFVLTVYENFGRLMVVNLSDRGLDPLVEYCNKMDGRIVTAFKKLEAAGIKDICSLLWKELGGASIRSDDRLGKRVCFYANMVSRYRADREGYHPDMVRIKLLG